MSYPGYPTNPEPTPDNNDQQANGYPQYPNYAQSTGSQAAGGYPQNSNGYQQYNDSNAGLIADPNPLESGDGSINVMAAVRYAGRRWVSNLNWLTWAGFLLAPFALLAVMAVLFFIGLQSGGTGGQIIGGIGLVVGLLAMLATALFAIWAYRGAVAQTDHPKMTFGLFIRESHVLSQILLIIIFLIVLIPLVLLTVWGAGAFNPLGTVSEAPMVILSLASLLLAPFFTLIPYLVADGRAVFEAIGDGFRAGRENWVKLVIYFVVESIVLNAAMFLTLGLATLVVTPLASIIRGHMTRQFNGGPIPLGTNQ